MNEDLLHLIKTNNDNTVFKALGISIDKLHHDETVLSLSIDHRHLQHRGLVHGGIYVLLAESAASLAGVCALKDSNMTVVGIEINANHLKSSKAGILKAHSRNIHHGQRTLIYEIKIVNQDNKLISISRCTLMKVPM